MSIKNARQILSLEKSRNINRAKEVMKVED